MNTCSTQGVTGKRASQIAKECQLKYDDIYSIIYAENMKPFGMLYDKEQESKIHRILTQLGKLKELIIESKLNEKTQD
jgi:hypothetical protein